MRLLEIVLLALALLCFLLDGFGWRSPRAALNLVALGLMFWVAEVLVVMLG